MRKFVVFGWIALLAAGCLDVEKKRYVFDPKHRTGELHLVNIGTDEADATTQDDDYRSLVNDYINGNDLNLPETWHVTGKELYEEEGHLNGVVHFTYDAPEAVLTITTDKKAYWKWCAPEGEKISASPTGTLQGSCMTWKKKEKRIEVEVSDDSASPPPYSLLDAHRRATGGG